MNMGRGVFIEAKYPIGFKIISGTENGIKNKISPKKVPIIPGFIIIFLRERYFISPLIMKIP